MVVPRNTNGKKPQPFLKSISFKEYRDKILKGKNVKSQTKSNLTKEQIIEKYEAIKDKHQNRTP